MKENNARMPLALKLVLGVLFFQALINTAGGVFMFVLSAEDVDHGREVPSLVYVLAGVSVFLGLTLLVCAVLLIRRVLAARPVVAGIEVLGVANGLLGLVLGAPEYLAGLGLAMLVLMHLFRREVTEWLDPRPLGQNDPATPPPRCGRRRAGSVGGAPFRAPEPVPLAHLPHHGHVERRDAGQVGQVHGEQFGERVLVLEDTVVNHRRTARHDRHVAGGAVVGQRLGHGLDGRGRDRERHDRFQGVTEEVRLDLHARAHDAAAQQRLHHAVGGGLPDTQLARHLRRRHAPVAQQQPQRGPHVVVELQRFVQLVHVVGGQGRDLLVGEPGQAPRVGLRDSAQHEFGVGGAHAVEGGGTVQQRGQVVVVPGLHRAEDVGAPGGGRHELGLGQLGECARDLVRLAGSGVDPDVPGVAAARDGPVELSDDAQQAGRLQSREPSADGARRPAQHLGEPGQGGPGGHLKSCDEVQILRVEGLAHARNVAPGWAPVNRSGILNSLLTNLPIGPSNSRNFLAARPERIHRPWPRRQRRSPPRRPPAPCA
jgi:hypothetical protein